MLKASSRWNRCLKLAMVTAFGATLLLSGCFVGPMPTPVAPEITSDGAGGAILVWLTKVNKGDLYAQRVDSEGNCLWGKEGRQICSRATHPRFPLVVSDDASGAIIAWSDNRHGSEDTFKWSAYAQRLGPQGNAIWAKDGICVSAGPVDDSQELLELVNDGSGGAILLWYNRHKIDERDELTVHAQRVGPDGNCLWGEQGIQICGRPPDARWAKLVSDGSGGAVIVWEDNRGRDTDIYAQRISSDGRILWSGAGVPVVTAGGAQLSPQIISDNMGNFIIAWMDSPHRRYDISRNDIYVQKIDSKGDLLWAEDGVPVCTSPKNQTHPRLASDGSGGGVIVWHDTRNRPNRDVYAQKVSSAGEILWVRDGVLIWDVSGVDESSRLVGSYDAQIVNDKAGGALVVWQVNPEASAVRGFRGGQIYAQRLGPAGELLWQESGVSVYENPSLKSQGYSSIASDNMGGIIIGSRVGKSSWTSLVYAQRIGPDGKLLWGNGGVKIYH